jgi:NADH-quinone oxidoreductase subunit C
MAAEVWDGALPSGLRQEFGEALEKSASYLGQRFIVVAPKAVVSVIRHLKVRESFEMLVDLTAVDYPKRERRFELVYEIYSFSRNERLRVKTHLADGEPAESLTGVHAGANWLEREVFDMFGIRFDGHPDLKRILLPEDWTGHPLRKEHSIIGMDNEWVSRNLGIDSGQ